MFPKVSNRPFLADFLQMATSFISGTAVARRPRTAHAGGRTLLPGLPVHGLRRYSEGVWLARGFASIIWVLRGHRISGSRSSAGSVVQISSI
jgi:hypothetical protein